MHRIMTDIIERKAIIDLVRREVVPAIGCTEPAAVALAVAKAREVLGQMPQQIQVKLSRNMLKNAMGVGIPGTGMVGLPIAVALGALVGKSCYGLEVLKEVTPEAVVLGQQLIASDMMTFEVQDPEISKVFVEVTCIANQHQSIVRIINEHQNICHIALNGQVILNNECSSSQTKSTMTPLCFNTVCDVALESDIDDLRFILDAARLNSAAANESMNGNYGHSIARVVDGSAHAYIMGNSIHTRMMAIT